MGADSAKVYSREIDSLRCIAMTTTIAFHCKLMPFGWAGVWLFFVISGYVVTLSITRHGEASSSWSKLRSFFGRRAVRIVPVYYLFVAVGIVVTAIMGIRQNPATILSLAAFYHNIAMAAGFGEMRHWPVGHLWTISIEMQFYVLYGLAACLCRPRTVVIILISFLFLAPLARIGASLYFTDRGWSPEAIAYTIYAGPGLHFDSFAMGALLAWTSLRMPLEKIGRLMIPVGLATISIYCGAYVGINALVLHKHGADIATDIVSGILYGQGREVFLYTALGLLSVCVLTLAATRNPTTQWLLGSKIMQWIGKVSYGGYVYHTLAMNLMSLLVLGAWGGFASAGLGHRVLGFALTYALTLAFAALSVQFFEQPLQRAYARRARKRSTSKSFSISAG